MPSNNGEIIEGDVGMKYDIQNNFKKIEKIPCHLLIGELDYVKEPFFSVVIPTYGRPDLLRNCIMSAVRQKSFDVPYEIIVVDNEASKNANATEALIKELDIPNLYYYKNSENIGAAGNWNRCVSVARSDWIIMCHDDDWLKENCLSTMKAILDKHNKDKPAIGYIRSSSESWFDPKLGVKPKEGNRNKPSKDMIALIKMDYQNVIWGGGTTWVGSPTCGTLLNKKSVLEVGGYNPELSPCFDCYLPYHMLGKYGVYKTYHSLGYYRWSENDTYRKSTLINLIVAYNEFLEILSRKHWIVRFFSNEHYADCVMYYRKKGKEANVEISDEEINSIRKLSYSTVKLKVLYLCRRINSGIKVLAAK